MSAELQRKVLALWGLERLDDATLENWPWLICAHKCGVRADHPEQHRIACPHEWHGYVPDFATDDAAALRLACEMQWARPEVAIYPPHNRGDHWIVELGSTGEGAHAPTLGEALLRALEASDG